MKILPAVKLRLLVPSRAKLTATAAAAVLGLGLAQPASAQTAAMVTQYLDAAFQMVVKQFMARMGLGVEGAIVQSGAATQAEIQKAAQVDKATAEGLEAYRQQEALRKRAQTMAEDLRQPANTCATMAAQEGLGKASMTGQARMRQAQQRALTSVESNVNTVQTLETAHKASNDGYCTPAEAAKGICRPNAANAALAGADQNAAFLFQARDGSPTFDGPRDGAQARAADSYIQRVIGGSAPPEQLRSVDYGKNPQARAYTELVRRYKAMLSMSAYSLNQAKEARNPIPGLGNDTQMATVSVPGFAANKADMSMLEAVQRFVATKFSPAAMREALKSESPNLMLRDIAQSRAFQLWIDQQTLLQDSRTEALMAHQLALLAEQTLRPQLDAQRRAATVASIK
jgi:hypothetical protein